MGSLLDWAAKWGNLAGVADLALSTVGFIATLYGLWRATTAARAAEQAAKATRDALLRSGTIAALATAQSAMEEIKRLQRAGSWPLLLDRYATLRRSLVSIRTSSPELGKKGSTALLGTIRHLKAIEEGVEEAVAAGTTPANVPKLNTLVSGQMDKLEELLTTLRTS